MTAYRLVALAMALMVTCGTVSCSKYGFSVTEADVSGPNTLGLSNDDVPVRGLVVYFHGSDQTAGVIKDDRKHTDFFDPLLRAGYAVVAADADGNAFGNPASQDAYRRLVVAARAKYGTGPLFFVAESMGGIAALTLLREDKEHLVKGMVGISPLMGLPAEADSISYIAGPWGGAVPATANPLSWKPEVFLSRRFKLYASKDDHVIPPIASALAFARRFKSVAKVDLADCTGGHVAVDCYRGSDVETWMASLA